MGATIFDIAGLSYQVFDATTTAAVSGLAAASSLLTFVAHAGTEYFVQFTGTATGAAGGNYTANISFVTPVPAAVLLLAPALAGLGLMARRRKA
jgi:hypothetical protein